MLLLYLWISSWHHHHCRRRDNYRDWAFEEDEELLIRSRAYEADWRIYISGFLIRSSFSPSSSRHLPTVTVNNHVTHQHLNSGLCCCGILLLPSLSRDVGLFTTLPQPVVLHRVSGWVTVFRYCGLCFCSVLLWYRLLSPDRPHWVSLQLLGTSLMSLVETSRHPSAHVAHLAHPQFDWSVIPGLLGLGVVARPQSVYSWPIPVELRLIELQQDFRFLVCM